MERKVWNFEFGNGRGILETSSKLRTRSYLSTEEEDDVDEDTESKRDESNGCHGPFGGHVVEHEDSQVCKRGCDDEGWNEESRNGGGGHVGIRV